MPSSVVKFTSSRGTSGVLVGGMAVGRDVAVGSMGVAGLLVGTGDGLAVGKTVLVGVTFSSGGAVGEQPPIKTRIPIKSSDETREGRILVLQMLCEKFYFPAFCIISNSYKEIIKIRCELPDKRVVRTYGREIHCALDGISLTKDKIFAIISLIDIPKSDITRTVIPDSDTKR
jgi:hypothetical protein